jgi:hypothetical protein
MDWSAIGRRSVVGALLALAAAELFLEARGSSYGIDFRGGTWSAGKALLAGHGLYPPASPLLLLHSSTAFVTPPLLALLGAALSGLPVGVALIVFNLACTLALMAGLRVLDVRDPLVWAFALTAFPFIDSLVVGQPDGIFALLAAVAWRDRDGYRGAFAVGALVAAKLFAWPLILWLLVTRRFRQAAAATAFAGTILLASWACIGFRGLLSYPHLLAADARAFESRSHSIVTALLHSGVPLQAAQPLSALIAVALALAIIITGRRGELSVFTAALTAGLLLSPVVWQHYLVLLLIPVAASSRTLDWRLGLLIVAFWLAPSESAGAGLAAWLVPVLAGAVALRVAWLERTSALTCSPVLLRQKRESVLERGNRNGSLQPGR